MRFALFPPSHHDDSKLALAWQDHPVTYQTGDEEKSAGWRYDLWEREIKVVGVTPDKVFEQARARLITLDILPSRVLELTGIWNVEGRLPQVGDVIFQRTHLVRIGTVNMVDVLSATCLGDVVDKPNRFELQYISTMGHPAMGFSRYSLIGDDKQVMFAIRTVSKPATLLTKLGDRITRRMQLKITQSVLNYLVQSTILDLTKDV